MYLVLHSAMLRYSHEKKLFAGLLGTICNVGGSFSSQLGAINI